MGNNLNDLSSLATQTREWLEKKKEKEFKGANFFWDQEKAEKFANTDLETLLFDEYFLDGEDWIWPGIVDAVKDVWYQYKENNVNLILVLGGIGCLPGYAPIKTEKGYTTIGDISIGDKILGSVRGTTEETTVVNKIDSGKKEVFRIYLNHGFHIDATKEHNYQVQAGTVNSGGHFWTFDMSVEEIVKYIVSDGNDDWDLIGLTKPNDSKIYEPVEYESLGKMQTYDITVNNESNYFLSYNDFITHNSGKTGGIDAILTWLTWFDFTCKYKQDSNIASPQEYYGVRPDSTVAFIALSKTLSKSKQITFSAMQGLFTSQFNKDYFPVDPRTKSMVKIPNNHTVIFPNTATEAANAGYNVYYYLMDEVSFLKEVEDSTLAKGSKTTSYDQAEQAHKSAEGRRESRFQKDGLGVLSSSTNYDEDYLLRKIRDIYKDPEEHDSAIYKILLPWKTNPDKFDESEGYFYFDTETYEILDSSEEISAMERYYEEPAHDDLIFGNPEESENKQILQQVKDNEFEFSEEEIENAKNFLSYEKKE